MPVDRPAAASAMRLPFHELVELVHTAGGLEDIARRQPERLRWAEQLLRLPEVWRLTRGQGVRVAILDTGIDADHPDLQGAIEKMRDFTGEGVEDLNGHGTHCAGVVAARANDVGFVGTAPLSSLLIGKVLANNGSGAIGAVAEAVDWAVDEGADIISMSLGSTTDSPELHRAVHAALAKGVIIVCAAGNTGELFANNIGFPGRYGSVITVAAHDRYGQPSGFSSRGASIDFMAPGSDIWSTYRQGGYAKLSGTSMATPFVAGLAALVLARHRLGGSHVTPIRNCEDMREHLVRMAAHPGHHDSARGHGPLLPFAYFAR
ncbi:MAG: S8 family peptidase [Geminicoccaceae bacterium]|jgi:subtilisin family serine protease|nr:S8 family peptidase [Geminicoccaceae bacterium]MCB9966507.1 S8 family peptidase [Geminicoccaceae bacterium]HRY26514.1 S8 family peptidase [Geminicoccaceae bacterium]